ncbi:MAG TPA: DUF167 domain-containing protein [Ktedonobacteraceae bacterium]
MRINVRVIPRSGKNLIEWEEGGLKVRLTAPPIDGVANDALIALLAQCLGLHKRDIQIVHGTTGRHKIVEITGMTAEAIEKKIKGTSFH